MLTVIDGFTKFVKLYPVVSTGTNEVIASLKKYFEYYGRPNRIISDSGRCFTSEEFTEYLAELNIRHTRVATASPQANGQAERVHRVLTAMLAKVTEPVQHADWVPMLQKVKFAMNNSVHQTTKRAPSELLFGARQRGEDVVHKVLPNDRYVIRDIENYQVTRVPYDGIMESSHMRRWADHLGMDLSDNGGSEERHSSDDEMQVDLDFDSEL